jgi:hypothetical protein
VALAVVVAVLVTWALRSGAEPVQAASAPITTSARPSTTTPLPEPRQRFTPTTPTTSPTPAAKPKPKPAPKPSSTVSGFRIKISSIGLERRLHGMGVSSDGTINPPKGKVIWFQGFGRVRPGAIGTAVIAGHVTKGGEPDTFYRLSRVDVGDRIQIIEADGKTKTYKVTRASAIDKTKVTTDAAVWGTNTSRSRLAIITCDDAFGYRSDGHRKANFVVIADRV